MRGPTVEAARRARDPAATPTARMEIVFMWMSSGGGCSAGPQHGCEEVGGVIRRGARIPLTFLEVEPNGTLRLRVRKIELLLQQPLPLPLGQPVPGRQTVSQFLHVSLHAGGPRRDIHRHGHKRNFAEVDLL